MRWESTIFVPEGQQYLFPKVYKQRPKIVQTLLKYWLPKTHQKSNDSIAFLVCFRSPSRKPYKTNSPRFWRSVFCAGSFVIFDSVPRFFLTRYLEIIKPGTSKWTEPGTSKCTKPGTSKWLNHGSSKWLNPGSSKWLSPGSSKWSKSGSSKCPPMLIVTRSWASHAPQGGRPRSSTCNWPGPRRCRTRCSHWYPVKETFAPQARVFII